MLPSESFLFTSVFQVVDASWVPPAAVFPLSPCCLSWGAAEAAWKGAGLWKRKLCVPTLILSHTPSCATLGKSQHPSTGALPCDVKGFLKIQTSPLFQKLSDSEMSPQLSTGAPSRLIRKGTFQKLPDLLCHNPEARCVAITLGILRVTLVLAMAMCNNK